MKNQTFTAREIIFLVACVASAIIYVIAPEFVSENEIFCLLAFFPLFIFLAIDPKRINK